MPFLPPNQQRQRTEGSRKKTGANLAHHRTEGTHACDLDIAVYVVVAFVLVRLSVTLVCRIKATRPKRFARVI